MSRTNIILFCLAFLWINHALKGQIITEAYIDLGENQVSDGLSSQFSNIGFLEKSKWGGETGYQLGLVQPQDVIFNSWYMNLYGKIRAGKVTLDLGGQYLWTAFSTDLRETNSILFTRTTLNHWQLGLGTSIRTYRLSHKAVEESSLLKSESRIIEKWNMLYHATYVLKPVENEWNLSASFTNYDHFIVQQENNPMFNLHFDYRISTPLSLYSELWYKPAGLMVIRVTYFGMLFRLGISWKI
jgi:hypothetical protein